MARIEICGKSWVQSKLHKSTNQTCKRIVLIIPPPPHPFCPSLSISFYFIAAKRREETLQHAHPKMPQNDDEGMKGM